MNFDALAFYDGFFPTHHCVF